MTASDFATAIGIPRRKGSVGGQIGLWREASPVDSAPDAAVLLVNNCRDALTSLREALQPLSLQIACATSDAEGLQLMGLEEFALAIVELRPSDFGGFEILERLKTNRGAAGVPVMLVTASEVTPEFRQRAFALGAVDVLALPVSPTELRAKVGVFAKLHRRARLLRDEAQAVKQRVQGALQEHEALERFESLAESMRQMAWMADNTGARFWFNRRWLEYTGTTPEQMKGWGFLDVYAPEERADIEQSLRAHFGAGRDWSDEWRIRGRDGTYRWFLTQAAPVKDHEGVVMRWFGTNTDINDQVLLRQQIRASEQKFREIFETANEGIWILNVDAQIEIVNQRMAEMLGYPPDEMIGRLKTDFVFQEDIGYVRRLFEQRRRGAVASVEVRFRRKDGTQVWTLMSARPLTRDGRFSGALDMFTDISARKDAAKQFEDELKAQVQERTRKLQEKSEQLESFAYTIAHDLRSPLRAISGYAEFTLEDYRPQLPDGANSNLEKIRASAHRLDTLIHDLLSYTRVVQLDFEEQDLALGPSVQWAIEQLQGEIERKAGVVEVPPQLPTVRGERSILDQIFLNLLSNALKFVAPGVPPRVTLTAEAPGPMVRVNVTDNGIGIPTEYQDRIFRVFERLQSSHRFEGTGVGLAIVARAAERLGGRAGVESAPGRGSTFWVELRKGLS